MKKVIILNEHHRKVVLDISTPELMNAAALSIVKGRFGGDNPYYPMDDPEEPKKLDFTEEDIEKMPPSMRGRAKTQLDDYKESCEYYRQQKVNNEAIRMCIMTNAAHLAIKILQFRKNYEDEGYEIMDVPETYPPSK